MSRGEKILIVLLFCFAGAGFVQKFAGIPGVVGYVAAMMAFVFGVSVWSRSLHLFSRRWFRPLAAGSAGILVGMFLILNPWEQGRGPGNSSDRNEGLNMAVERVFQGQTPYYPSNPHAGPLSVLPGAIALAAPFVLLGDSGYQNILWLCVFFALAAWHFRDRVPALFWLLTAVFASPAVAYEYISGGDMLANGIYVPFAMALAIQAWKPHAPGSGFKWAALVLLGVCLTSRANCPFLIPLFGAAVWRLAGWKTALLCVTIASFVVLLLTVPLYLYDRTGFTPLMSRKKLALVDEVIPNASWMLVGATALSGIAAGGALLLRRGPDVLGSTFRYGAMVMITPMLLMVLLKSLVAGRLDFELMRDRFGLLYLFFALLGWGGELFVLPRKAPSSARMPGDEPC